MALHKITLQGEDDSSAELEMTDAELAFLKKVAAALNAQVTSYETTVLIDDEEIRPRCACGALVFSGCFCNISVSDFLRTGRGRRI